MSKISFGVSTIFMLTLMAPAMLTTGAFAQPPSNDDFDSATLIPSLPFSDTFTLAEATTAEDDPRCPPTGRANTVWYSFSPNEDVSVQADTVGSEDDATLSVYTGSRGSLGEIACDANTGSGAEPVINFQATAGQTYYFMIGSYDGEAFGNVVFTLYVEGEDPHTPPPPFDIEVTINPTGTVNPRTGVVTVSGTIECTEPASFGIDGEVTQRAGRASITGELFTYGYCLAEEQPTVWDTTLQGENGKFVPGTAVVSITAGSCGSLECDYGNEESATV